MITEPSNVNMARKAIVGIVGGGDRRERAMAAGSAVAACGAILLTGGGVPEQSQSAEVKDAAIAGYRKTAGRTGGIVGILPARCPKWDLSTNPGSLLLWTGMCSYERDAINGLTPDIVVAFRGGEGTLCEMAFALFAKAPVLIADSFEHHRKKFREHKSKGSLQSALKAASNCYVRIRDVRVDAGQLLSFLERALGETGEDPPSATPYSPDALRKHLQSLPRQLDQTGFPGLPALPESKAQFEETIVNISLLLP
jgi:hypothetical protein